MKRPSGKSLQILGFAMLAVAAAFGISTMVLALIAGDFDWAR